MKKEICVALVPRIDNRHKCGYRLQSFHNKKDYEDFVENLHGMIYGDDVLVILSGGSDQMVTVAKAKEMRWLFEES